MAQPSNSGAIGNPRTRALRIEAPKRRSSSRCYGPRSWWRPGWRGRAGSGRSRRQRGDEDSEPDGDRFSRTCSGGPLTRRLCRTHRRQRLHGNAGWRHVIVGDEEIRHQRHRAIDTVVLEIPHARDVQHLVVDAELLGELPRRSLVRIACAASPMISGVRLARIMASPPSRLPTAAVAIVVRGHSALTATPADFSSPIAPARTCSCRTSPSCRRWNARTIFASCRAAATASGCAGWPPSSDAGCIRTP